jgi:hypothetical protein
MKNERFFKDFKFCCNFLKNNVTLEEDYGIGKVVVYHTEVRMFSLPVIKKNGYLSPIKYCPYCGKKFQNDLNKEWWKTINKEFGDGFLDSAYSPKRKNLPLKFLTDEWWKKRGL